MHAGDRVIDVGIVAVLPLFELSAAQRVFDIPEQERATRFSPGRGPRYWLRHIRDKNGNDLTVAITFVGEQGNSLTAAVATELILHLHPRLLILTGTAAGIRGKVKLGDVVPSGLVIDYEGAKLTEVGTRPRFDREKNIRPEIFEQLQLFDRSAKNGVWLTLFEDAQGKLPRQQRPRVPLEPDSVLGYVASGEKLLADGSLERFATEHEERTKAGEKEAFGFAVAANKQAIPWLVIKGISDYGDPKSRDGNDKDTYHPTATNAAASYIRAFLQEGLDIDELPHVAGNHLPREPPFEQFGPLCIEAALISAEDKTGLETLARFLASKRVRLVGTPGATDFLSHSNVTVESTWAFVKTTPLFDLRATLHPYLMAAIATSRNDVDRVRQLRERGMCPVGLIICNTKSAPVPARATTAELADLVATVSVGIPLLLRWGLRQFKTTTTIVEPARYDNVIDELRDNNMCLSPAFRAEHFRRTLKYVADFDRTFADTCEQLWPKNL